MQKITSLFIISLFINGMFGDEVSVMEGDSVTLHTNDADIQKPDATVIWTFGAQKTRIARINRAANKAPIYDADILDGRFRDRLKINDQTGDLTITNIKTTDSGLYEVQILVGSKNIPKRFNIKGVSNPESDQLKSVSVKDGDSVTLLTDVPNIKTYDGIQWRCQGIRIAQFDKSASNISENDDIQDKRFRDKLQLDVQTGSLKIKNIRMNLSGLYEVEISSSNYTIHQLFTVTVSGEVKSVSVKKGDPVTINTDVPDIKTYDRILLIFGCDDRIAEVNKQNKQFTLDKRFREGLTLNDQTGDLTITDIRTEDAGDYELKMSSRRRTIQRRFRVNVGEPGLSPAAIAGISGFLILLMAVVIIYRRKIAEWLGGMKTVKVIEGESVDLKTKVKDIKTALIEWRFGETLIAEINPAKNIFTTYNDDLFKGKLNLNPQTGDLNIKDIRREHIGVYKLKIIRNKKTSYRRFYVSVRYETRPLQVYEGESVNLKTKVKDIKRVEKIEWRFGFKETLIAEINPANNIFSTYDDDKGIFRGKLKLNEKTGDLNINDIREEHCGVYKLKIIRGEKTSYKRFKVSVKWNVETLSVNEGESADLKTEVKNIKRDDVIEWTFGETLIAEINPANNISRTYDDDKGLFRGKLNLNEQTGDLNIKDFREKHDGVYKLKIIRGGKTSYTRFRVFVRSCREGDSVEMRGGDSVTVEMDPLLNNSRQ
nr:uncharacterized protein LOC129453465 [Misgurnus anguillicaudatus]